LTSNERQSTPPYKQLSNISNGQDKDDPQDPGLENILAPIGSESGEEENIFRYQTDRTIMQRKSKK
jgi:hypothetical protein